MGGSVWMDLAGFLLNLDNAEMNIQNSGTGRKDSSEEPD